jgi:hypothetical protein
MTKPPEVEIVNGLVQPSTILEMVLDLIVKHWDDNEDLCPLCQSWWDILPQSFRDEFRHSYDFDTSDETEDDPVVEAVPE